MNSDRHEVFEHRIDEALAAGASAQHDESLRQHLQSCPQCQDYAAASAQVISILNGFSFEIDPNLNAKIFAALNARMQPVEAAEPSRRWLSICLLALILTVAGSFVELQFGGLLASVLDIQRLQVRHGLFAFWIIPSLCLLLLFPLLPLLSATGPSRKERIL